MRSWLTHALHWRRCSGSTQHSASTSRNCDLLVLARLLVRLAKRSGHIYIEMRFALARLPLHVKLITLHICPYVRHRHDHNFKLLCVRRATQGPLRSGLAGGEGDMVSPPSAAGANGGRHMPDQQHQLAAQLGAMKAAHEHERAQAAARMRSATHISAGILCSTVCLVDGT